MVVQTNFGGRLQRPSRRSAAQADARPEGLARPQAVAGRKIPAEMIVSVTAIIITLTVITDTTTEIIVSVSPIINTATPITNTMAPITVSVTPIINTMTPIISKGFVFIVSVAVIINTAALIIITDIVIIVGMAVFINTTTAIPVTVTPIINTTTPITNTATNTIVSMFKFSHFRAEFPRECKNNVKTASGRLNVPIIPMREIHAFGV